MDRETDARIRWAAVQRLEDLKRVYGDVLPWSELIVGFDFEESLQGRSR